MSFVFGFIVGVAAALFGVYLLDQFTRFQIR